MGLKRAQGAAIRAPLDLGPRLRDIGAPVCRASRPCSAAPCPSPVSPSHPTSRSRWRTRDIPGSRPRRVTRRPTAPPGCCCWCPWSWGSDGRICLVYGSDSRGSAEPRGPGWPCTGGSSGRRTVARSGRGARVGPLRSPRTGSGTCAGSPRVWRLARQDGGFPDKHPEMWQFNHGWSHGESALQGYP